MSQMVLGSLYSLEKHYRFDLYNRLDIVVLHYLGCKWLTWPSVYKIHSMKLVTANRLHTLLTWPSVYKVHSMKLVTADKLHTCYLHDPLSTKSTARSWWLPTETICVTHMTLCLQSPQQKAGDCQKNLQRYWHVQTRDLHTPSCQW